MGLPAEPDLEFLARAVLAQIVQDRTALLWSKPIDMGGEVAIDEQRLALRYRMRAHDRVRRLREALRAPACSGGCAIHRNIGQTFYGIPRRAVDRGKTAPRAP